MFKVIVIIVLSLLIVVSSAHSLEYQSIETSIKNYERKINDLKDNIDISVFNDTEILLKMDFDTDNLIAFTQDKIVFHPYVGLLRGVNGTLNSRAGNSLDQSILLAKLLNDAGLETRIANGQLTNEQTKQLLMGFGKADIPNHIGNGEDFDSALKELTKQSTNNKVDWQNSNTNKRYTESLKIVESTLKKHNLSLNKKNIMSDLIKNNKDYFWVEYRLNITDKWKNAHPAFAKGNQIDVKALSYFKDSVPEKYIHQVKIEAFIQQKIGKKLKTHSLMKPWIKPASNLQNFLITYSNAPSGVSVKSDYDLVKIIENANFFTPTFNGSPIGGKVFDLKGRLIDAEAMNSNMGALFKTLGDKTLMSVDALEGNKKDDSALQLKAQWLQFTFINPNGDEFVQKRYIYQSSKESIKDEKLAKIQLMTEYSLLVNTGEQPESYLAKVYLDMISDSLPLLKSSSRKVFNDDGKTTFPKKIPQSEFELLTQYFWMNNNPNSENDTIRFRANANMLGFKRGFVDEKTAFLAVDIISNKQEFINRQDTQFLSNPRAAFQHGIWETASEWLPSRILGLSGSSIDTLKVTRATDRQNLGFELYQSTEADKNQLKQKFAENSILLEKIMSDLDHGFVIAIPAQHPKDLMMTGWWRINPESGETLGMIGNGGGSEVTEYLIQNAQTALSLIRAVGNLKKCEEKTNDLEKLCCLAEAHFNNVGGLAFGGALGGAIGTSAAAVFDIVDFTTEAATGSGIAPSTGGKLCAGIDFPEF